MFCSPETSSDYPLKPFEDRTAAGTSALNPVNKAGRRTATTATSGAPTRKIGMKLKTSVRVRVDAWLLSSLMPPTTLSWRG